MSRLPTPLSDAQANQVLARAVELDAKLVAATDLGELRKAAIEAGISPTAFDAAVQEIQLAKRQPRPPFGIILRRYLLAAGAFWAVLSAVTRVARWLTPSDTAHTLSLLLATAAGIHIAQRLQATWLRTLLIAVGAGQAVVFMFHLAGIATAQPHVLNWAVTFTGLVAAGVTTLLRRSPPRLEGETVSDASPPREVQEPQGEPRFYLGVPAPQP